MTKRAKYPIAPGLPKMPNFPMPPSMLKAANLLLELMRPRRGGRELSIKRLRVKSYDGADVPVLVMSPKGLTEPAPCLVYLHGGGFATKAAPLHYHMAREYALRAGCRVLLPDYRLAPAHCFPAAPEDAFAVYRHALEMPEVDKQRLAVGGDSAGGGLAAALCLMARDRGLKLPCFQLLIYPVADRRMGYESMARFEDTPMWNARLNRRMWQWYLPEGAEHLEYASPIEAGSLKGLPEAYVELAEFDCLHDEGLAYAEALSAAGIRVELNDTLGTVHGFDLAEKNPLVRDCVERRCRTLKRAFCKAEDEGRPGI